MATFNDMVEEVLLALEGFSGDLSPVGTLSGSLTNSASTFTVAGAPFSDGLGFATGLVEVGEELVFAQQFVRSTGVFSGCLRGWRGTAAVSHSSGEIVRSNPLYPRVSVKKAINYTIANIPLLAMKTVDVATDGYDRLTVPSDVDMVLSVALSPTAWTKQWAQIESYRLVQDPSGVVGKALNIPRIPSGYTVRVSYAGTPTELASNSDLFSATGLPDYCLDAVLLGAQWRLLSTLDPAKVSGLGQDQAYNGQVQQRPSPTNTAKYMLAMYNTRVAECKQRQNEEWKAPVYRTRGLR